MKKEPEINELMFEAVFNILKGALSGRSFNYVELDGLVELCSDAEHPGSGSFTRAQLEAIFLDYSDNSEMRQLRFSKSGVKRFTEYYRGLLLDKNL